METDIRSVPRLREEVRNGLGVLLAQGREIWGSDRKHTLDEIVVRLMVGVGDLGKFGDLENNTVIARIVEAGDLARLQRDGGPGGSPNVRDIPTESTGSFTRRQIKKELGNVILSTVRWIDDLGLDVLECLDLAIEAQEKFARSGRPR